MGRERKNISPTYTELIVPTYEALKQLGGSGTNNEIYESVIANLHLSNEKVMLSHSFHVFADHLYVFFGEMSIQIFCPFSDGVICFLY